MPGVNAAQGAGSPRVPFRSAIRATLPFLA